MGFVFFIRLCLLVVYWWGNEFFSVGFVVCILCVCRSAVCGLDLLGSWYVWWGSREVVLGICCGIGCKIGWDVDRELCCEIGCVDIE